MTQITEDRSGSGVMKPDDELAEAYNEALALEQEINQSLSE